MSTTPMVELTGLSRAYSSDPPVNALQGVHLTIESGEWLAIVGPSGSGKSTLLNMIGLLDRPSSGSYRFAGEDVSELDDASRAGLRGRSIGFVFQAFHLLAHRTVVENVMIAELYRGCSRAARRRQALEALDRVGLADRAEFLPTRLSGGQRQRVAIARAVAGQPRLLLCDEPTGNLDSHTAGEMLELFDRLWRDGLTIVVITHDDGVAGRAARRVRIVDGELRELGEGSR